MLPVLYENIVVLTCTFAANEIAASICSDNDNNSNNNKRNNNNINNNNVLLYATIVCAKALIVESAR